MLPVLVKHNDFIIYTYPLFMGLCWGLSYKLCQNQIIKYNLQVQNFKILFLTTFILAWIGSKIAFLIFTAKSHANDLIMQDSFWLGGGFVFFGGLILGVLNVILITKVIKIYSFKDSIYFLAPLTLVHAIGRIGCFLSGCCFGSETTFFLNIFVHNANRHPVQLYESISLFIIYFILNRMLEKKQISKVLISYFFLYSLVRFCLEFFRGDSIRGVVWAGFSTSQTISIFMMVLCLIIVLTKKKIISSN